MASAFSHAFAAYTFKSAWAPAGLSRKAIWIGMLSAVMPDADVLAFSFGIPYEHVLGHRGITHSLFFALLWAWLMMEVFFYEYKRAGKDWWRVWLYLALCTASHGVFDALTNGGRGVAFFAPFENSRYFFPWRPILVSPLGAANFFSEWGMRVVKSELLYVWLPGSLLLLASWAWRFLKRKNTP